MPHEAHPVIDEVPHPLSPAECGHEEALVGCKDGRLAPCASRSLRHGFLLVRHAHTGKPGLAEPLHLWGLRNRESHRSTGRTEWGPPLSFKVNVLFFRECSLSKTSVTVTLKTSRPRASRGEPARHGLASDDPRCSHLPWGS